ncbi:hypothetical protein [Flaviflexus huanghaiensis]|uniref:hypothetical protein n=1 Tax=Flaviflexus huanghaiensis TaxID=1111473 RepID=UPI0015FD2BDF|nr:hypothetical protein [Flaviflexus huanghaiensis]
MRYDQIATTGKISIRYADKLHDVGIGRAYKHQRVTALLHAPRHDNHAQHRRDHRRLHDRTNLDVTIINATTGEILRELNIDPPTTTSHNKNKNRVNPQIVGSPYSDVLRHHIPMSRDITWSGWRDLNPRPLDPQVVGSA